jgi:hypothetical protein
MSPGILKLCGVVPVESPCGLADDGQRELDCSKRAHDLLMPCTGDGATSGADVLMLALEGTNVANYAAHSMDLW